MCVFGASGAGKSFFTKLQIIRNWLIGIEQFVIDPEREYQKYMQKLRWKSSNNRTFFEKLY